MNRSHCLGRVGLGRNAVDSREYVSDQDVFNRGMRVPIRLFEEPGRVRVGIA